MIVLPWPPYTLHPNSRPHWSVLARSKADYRYACHMLAVQSGIKVPPDARPLVSLEFVPPNRRARDLDGCLSSVKAGLDGVADAIGCDDSRWRLQISLAEGEIGGFVRVTVA